MADGPRDKRDEAAAGKYQCDRRIGSELPHRIGEPAHPPEARGGSTNGSRQARHQVAKREPPAEMHHDVPCGDPVTTGAESKRVRGALRHPLARALIGLARR